MDHARPTAELAHALIAAQFPQWSALSVTPVAADGWDNASFRLGEQMSIRLPTAAPYTAAVDKEVRWLPVLAPSLPVAIPAVLALGQPGSGFAWPWSVRRWLPGAPASVANIGDGRAFAADVAGFLTALQRIETDGGPGPGAHNFMRGGPLATYDDDVRLALDGRDGDGAPCPVLAATTFDRAAATALWETGLVGRWEGPAVWLHGDVAPSNLLVDESRLVGVLDFGALAVGDPAGDLVIAWTLFAGPARSRFRAAIEVDAATWTRARCWALWKALVTLRDAGADESTAGSAAAQRFGWRLPPGALIRDLTAAVD